MIARVRRAACAHSAVTPATMVVIERDVDVESSTGTRRRRDSTVAQPFATWTGAGHYVRRMIIEAGYDLHVLLFTGNREPGTLRMVCLDADLRVTDIRTVLPSFSGNFDADALDSIDRAIPGDIDELPQFDTRFVALGYDVGDASRYPHGFDWERVKVVEEWLGCRGVRLLGIQVSDHEQWASTGPMHSFETYVLEDDLPRVLVIPGPHPFGVCPCAACAPKRERRRSRRSTRAV